MAGDSSSSRSGGMALGLIAILMVLVLGPILIIKPDRMLHVVDLEQRLYAMMLGAGNAQKIRSAADETYLSSFANQDDGIGVDNAYFNERSEVSRYFSYLIMHRLAYFQSWDVLAVLVVLVCSISGQMKRRAGMWDFSYVSPRRWKQGQSHLVLSMAALAIAFVLPAPMPPLVLPVAILWLGYALLVLSSAKQKRM